MRAPTAAGRRLAALALALVTAVVLAGPAAADCNVNDQPPTDPGVQLKLLASYGRLHIESTDADQEKLPAGVVVADGVVATPSINASEGSYTYIFQDVAGRRKVKCYLASHKVDGMSLFRCDKDLPDPLPHGDQAFAPGQAFFFVDPSGGTGTVSSVQGDSADAIGSAAAGLAAVDQFGQLRGFTAHADPNTDAAGCPLVKIVPLSRWSDEIAEVADLPPTLMSSFWRLFGVRSAAFAVVLLPFALWHAFRNRRLNLGTIGLFLGPVLLAALLTGIQVMAFGVAGVRY